LLDGQIGGLGTARYPVDKVGHARKQPVMLGP
jgi:hypothetical protein